MSREQTQGRRCRAHRVIDCLDVSHLGKQVDMEYFPKQVDLQVPAATWLPQAALDPIAFPPSMARRLDEMEARYQKASAGQKQATDNALAALHEARQEIAALTIERDALLMQLEKGGWPGE